MNFFVMKCNENLHYYMKQYLKLIRFEKKNFGDFFLLKHHKIVNMVYIARCKIPSEIRTSSLFQTNPV